MGAVPGRRGRRRGPRRGGGARVHPPGRRGPLASEPCGSPSPVGSDSRAPARRRSACGPRSRTAARSWSSGCAAPEPPDPAGLRDPRDANYWRRAADVALSGVVRSTPGLREAPVVRVEEDDDGVTVVHERVTGEPPAGLFIAALPRALRRRRPGRGAVAGHRPAAHPARPRRAARRLAHAGPDADGRHRRAPVEPPRVVAGAVRRPAGCRPARRPGRRPTCRSATAATRWPSTGRTSGPGRWVPTWATSRCPRARGSRRCSTPTSTGCPQGLATREQAELGAQVTAVYTALTRVDWALGRVAEGEGALAGKFRHPAVAPYIVAMQRQVDPDRGPARLSAG